MMTPMVFTISSLSTTNATPVLMLFYCKKTDYPSKSNIISIDLLKERDFFKLAAGGKSRQGNQKDLRQEKNLMEHDCVWRSRDLNNAWRVTPPINIEQGTRNLSPTTTRYRVLPTSWVKLEVDSFPEPTDNSQFGRGFDFHIVKP